MEPGGGKVTKRFVVRTVNDGFLRLVSLLSRSFDGDVLSGTIFLTLAHANTQHLVGPQRDFHASVGVVPDDQRRPASIHSISAFLGVPYETTRRHVNRLIERGLCERRSGKGVVVPASVVEGELGRQITANGYASFVSTLTILRRAGVDLNTLE
jgi:hypothetical protein